MHTPGEPIIERAVGVDENATKTALPEPVVGQFRGRELIRRRATPD